MFLHPFFVYDADPTYTMEPEIAYPNEVKRKPTRWHLDYVRLANDLSNGVLSVAQTTRWDDAFYHRLQRILDRATDTDAFQVPYPAMSQAFPNMDAAISDYASQLLGRDDELRNVLTFVRNNTGARALLITGPPGIGKTTFLARLVADCPAVQPDTIVIRHFCGVDAATQHSANLLRSLAAQLQESAADPRPLPHTKPDLQAVFLESLVEASSKHARVVVVIDAVNELDDKDVARLLLPAYLPEKVRFVLSTLAGSNLDALASRSVAVETLELHPLRPEDARAVVERQLPDGQASSALVSRILEAAEGNPLFLTVLAKAPHGETQPDLRAGSRIEGLLDRSLASLREPLRDAAERLLLACLLPSEGLTDGEIAKLLPVSMTDRREVLTVLRPLLKTIEGRTTLFHGLFKATVRKWATDDELSPLAAALLSERLASKTHLSTSLTSLIDLMGQARQPERLPELLTDLSLLQQACAKYGPSEVGWALTYGAGLTISDRDRLLLEQVGSTFLVHEAFLQTDPGALSSLLLNELADDSRLSGSTRVEAWRSTLASSRACWLERIESQQLSATGSAPPRAATQHSPGRIAIRSDSMELLLERSADGRWEQRTVSCPQGVAEVPFIHVEHSLWSCFDRENSTSSLATKWLDLLARADWRSDISWLSSDPSGSRFAASTFTGLVSLFDERTGDMWDTVLTSSERPSGDTAWLAYSGGEAAALRDSSGQTPSFLQTAFDSSGDWLVLTTDGLDALTYSVETRAFTGELTGHSSRITSLAPRSGHPSQMFTGLDDGTIVLWDVRSGRELDTFSGHADSVVSVAASPDGAWLLSSGQDRTISLWSVDEAAVVVKYPLRQAPIAGFFVPEGLFVLDCTGVFTLFEIHNLDSMHAEAAA